MNNAMNAKSIPPFFCSRGSKEFGIRPSKLRITRVKSMNACCNPRPYRDDPEDPLVRLTVHLRLPYATDGLLLAITTPKSDISQWKNAKMFNTRMHWYNFAFSRLKNAFELSSAKHRSNATMRVSTASRMQKFCCASMHQSRPCRTSGFGRVADVRKKNSSISSRRFYLPSSS